VKVPAREGRARRSPLGTGEGTREGRGEWGRGKEEKKKKKRGREAYWRKGGGVRRRRWRVDCAGMG